MGGSHAGASSIASNWPMTRAANSAMQLHSSIAATRLRRAMAGSCE